VARLCGSARDLHYRLRDAQGGFGVSGKKSWAVIDTVGVITPRFVPVLLAWIRLTRNQAGRVRNGRPMWRDAMGD